MFRFCSLYCLDVPKNKCFSIRSLTQNQPLPYAWPLASFQPYFQPPVFTTLVPIPTLHSFRSKPNLNSNPNPNSFQLQLRTNLVPTLKPTLHTSTLKVWKKWEILGGINGCPGAERLGVPRGGCLALLMLLATLLFSLYQQHSQLWEESGVPKLLTGSKIRNTKQFINNMFIFLHRCCRCSLHTKHMIPPVTYWPRKQTVVFCLQMTPCKLKVWYWLMPIFLLQPMTMGCFCLMRTPRKASGWRQERPLTTTCWGMGWVPLVTPRLQSV